MYQGGCGWYEFSQSQDINSFLAKINLLQFQLLCICGSCGCIRQAVWPVDNQRDALTGRYPWLRTGFGLAWVKRVRWRIHPSGRTVGGQPWIGHSKLCSAVRWLQTFSLRKRRQLWPGLSCMCLQCSLFKRPLSVFFVFFLWKQTTCDDGSVYQPYQAASEYGIGSDVGTIQLEIYENGPVAVGFLVCQSFENFFVYVVSPSPFIT